MTTTIRLTDLRGQGVAIHGQAVVGVEQNLAKATGATTVEELAAAINELTWTDCSEDGETPDVQPCTSWYSTATIVDSDGVELLYLEAQRTAGGVVVLAPVVEGQTSRWYAAELSADDDHDLLLGQQPDDPAGQQT